MMRATLLLTSRNGSRRFGANKKGAEGVRAFFNREVRISKRWR